MKAFLIGDVHLGRKFRNKDIPLDKRGVREQILRLRFQQYIDLAIKSVKLGKSDFVVQLGDLFDSFSVSYEDLLFAYEQLSKFEKEQIPCVIIAGNHDLPKDKSRVSALAMLARMFQSEVQYVKFVMDTVEIFRPFLPRAEATEEHIFVPYSHEHDSREGIDKYTGFREEKCYLYGHFDEPFPVEWQSKFTHVYTGHIHSPKEEGNISVIGSILPLTFAEDINNSFMRTVTLDEYEKDLEMGVSDYRCYRIKLREGEELPAEKHCLQMSVYSEKNESEGENLNVEFETFDIEKLLHEALDETGLFDEIFGLYNEYKMAEVNE